MKKFIILFVALLFVVGGGIGVYFGVFKKDADNLSAESDQIDEIEESAKDPFVLAKEKLILIPCDNSANLCANVNNLNGVSLSYVSLDSNIAKVDSFGNVTAQQEGTTFVKSFVTFNDEEYSYLTKIVVLPLEVKSETKLIDENKNIVSTPLVGEKYYLKFQCDVNLDFYELSLLASQSIKISNKEISSNDCSCEIYFETKTEHSLQFKLVLNADNITKEYLSDKILIDNSEKVENPEDPKENPDDDNSDQDEPNNPSDSDEPNNPDDSQDEPNPPVDDNPNPTEPEDDPNDENENPKDDEPVESKKIFKISSLSKNVTIADSTIYISNFTNQTSISLSFSLLNSDKKYTIKYEIIDGDNISFEISTCEIGMDIFSKGTTIIKFFALEDPSIFQTFTIIIE